MPTSFLQLPLVLKATEVARVLGVSKSAVYELMRAKGFPVLEIGRRKVVPRDVLIQWIEKQISEDDIA